MDWRLPNSTLTPSFSRAFAGFWRPPVGRSGRIASSNLPANVAGTFESISRTIDYLLCSMRVGIVPSFTQPLPLREFCMHIVQIAPLTGAERVVHWLTEEFVALGHDVTLFASGNSIPGEA
jgi:hypothetical protein